MELRGYDDWKTTDRTPDTGSGVKHRCTDCEWTGRGLAAADHHLRTHHRIEVAGTGMLAKFSCCPETPDETPDICGWCKLPREAVNPKLGEASCYCDMGN